ncbi:hypothetical protein SAMN05443582_1089 [Phyllobacterium sp. OV277]|nr:hypothetical protein SAMN05443582_1089 [Phyllobacterium sp. OV277]
MQAVRLGAAFIATRPGRFSFFDIALCNRRRAGCTNFPRIQSLTHTRLDPRVMPGKA